MLMKIYEFKVYHFKILIYKLKFPFKWQFL